MKSRTEKYRINYRGESKERADEPPLLVSDSDRPHLVWSNFIKQQHYHLQRAFFSSRECHSQSDTSECLRDKGEAPESDGQTCQDDLKCWQRLINSDDEAKRLKDYARAMHDLATKYWEAPLATFINSGQSRNGERNDQGSRLSTSTTSSTPFPTAAVAGSTDAISIRKRSRDFVRASIKSVDQEEGAILQRRYDDRIQSSLECVAAFYLGRPSILAKGGASECLFYDLPLVFLRALKPWRREFFRSNARTATRAEIEDRILDLSNSAEQTGGAVTSQTAWGQAMRYVRVIQQIRQAAVTRAKIEGPVLDLSQRDDQTEGAVTSHMACGQATRHVCDTQSVCHAIASGWSTSEAGDVVLPVPALHAIDVGGCYGPFFAKSIPHDVLRAVPLHVVGLDLCPYAPLGPRNPPLESCASLSGSVWKGDWLSLDFFKISPPRPANHPFDEGCPAAYLRFRPAAPQGSEGEMVELRAVALELFDVVFFCLLLSYLPSARLRYRACVNAYLSLKEGGLLVIVSTRTQGSRRRKWVEEWVEAISSIGFSRVHQAIREKIVVLCFSKQSHPEIRKRLNNLNHFEQDTEVSEEVDALLEQLNGSPFASYGLHVMADEGI
ncbi:unnamed protein product [Phytomonas sp. Hart1]|nr:unnamed protein product [Phytomonas sp. Hart1]|eukprot:CCW68317.1 unnamed protein product [Phytomonas sp. isolate Hart1]